MHPHEMPCDHKAVLCRGLISRAASVVVPAGRYGIRRTFY
jgi:hypothetical protein